MTAVWIERSFVGAILCVITVILILFTFNNNEWVTVLSDYPQISPPWWWDNHKMRARKNIGHCGQPAEDVRYWRKANANSTCDVTDLDQLDQSASRTYDHGSKSWFSWTTSADRSFTLVQPIMTWTWFKSMINIEPGSAEPRFDWRWWNAPLVKSMLSCYSLLIA